MAYGAAFFFTLALTLYALVDVIATEPSRCRIFPKAVWVVLVLVPLVGAGTWLMLGRPERSLMSSGQTEAAERAAPPRRRPLGPDDDPRLGEITRRTAHPAKGDRNAKAPGSASRFGPNASDLKAWEEELKRREDRLRRREKGDPPA